MTGSGSFSTTANFNNFFTPYQAGNANTWGLYCMEPLGRKIVGTADDYDLVLAESIDIDEEKFIMTIKVREGITFHSGDTLDAEDVAWTIQSWIDYGRGAQIGNPVAVRRTGDYTVEVQWDSFNVNYKTWILPTMIFSKQTFDKIGLDAMMTSFDGTGPYMMDEYVVDYSLSFKRYDNYWQEHDWGPDTITCIYVSDTTSMTASVLAGDVDYMQVNSPEVKTTFESYGWELLPQLANTGRITAVMPVTNVETDPWYDVKVREAVFTYGIDYEGAANAIVGAAGYHTDAIGYKATSYYDEGLEFTSLDYDKARRLLAEAGYPDGFTTTIYTQDDTKPAAIVQGELKKLGIQAEVKVIDEDETWKIWGGKNTEGGLFMFTGSVTDPILDRLNKFWGPFGMSAGATKFSEEELRLYDKIATARSMEEQDKFMYDFCVQFVQKDFHFMPLCNVVGSAAIGEHLVFGKNMGRYSMQYWDPLMIGYKE